MKFPYRVFYIIAFLVLPLVIIAVFVNADSINSALQGRTSVTKESDVRSILVAPIFLFLFAIQLSPRKMPDFVRAGYRAAKQAHVILKAIRTFWLGTLILSLVVYGLAVLYLMFISPIKDWSTIPDFAWVPVTTVISALMYVLTYAVHSGWEKSEHFRLFMARETGKEASTKNTRIDRLKGLIESIRWYDQYVRMALKTRIANLEDIVFKLSTLSSDESGRQMSLFYKAYESGDELEPLKLITSLDNATTTGFESSDGFGGKLKNVELIIAIIVGVATIVATIVNIFR